MKRISVFFLLLILIIWMPWIIAAEAVETTTSDNKLPVPVGKVIWVKGTFKATMPNKEVRVLQKASVIYLHDTLTTDAGAQAQIAFTDNTLMTFRPDTKFFIDQYDYQPQGKKEGKGVGKYVMNLIEGGFRTVTGAIAKENPDDYKVNTPVATIGVRGTDYSIYIHKGELFVQYIEGKPCVTSGINQLCLDDKNRYVNVEHPGAVPQPLAQQPAIFKETLQIVPVKISSFVSPAGTITPGGRVAPGPGTPGTSPKGTVNSFCIQ